MIPEGVMYVETPISTLALDEHVRNSDEIGVSSYMYMGGKNMLRSMEGIYRHGNIELLEPPTGIKEDTYVIITFLRSTSAGSIDLRSRGIDSTQAADLRQRVSTFIEEWESPEMEVYDRYGESKSRL